MNEDKVPVCLGGVGAKWGRVYRQGNRVYDSNSIAMALLSDNVGNLGGNSYLYLVRRKKNADLYSKDNRNT